MSKRRNSKNNKKNKNKILAGILALCMILALIIFGASTETINAFSNAVGLNIALENDTDTTNNQTNYVPTENDLKVYFIDVGQADSILVTNKQEYMLIDAGNNDDGNDVVSFLKNKGISKIDYLIGTHPHEDHIGGLDDVINNFEIKNIYMPKIETTTKTFKDVLSAISNKKLKVTAPKKGDKFDIGEARCEVMTDSILNKDNLNLSSIVIRLEFGNNSFLFMGDAETENEKTITWPKTDVLKVGHHGSNTSTSKNFLNEVSPTYGIIMAGEGNTYGLPKEKILQRLAQANVKIYRTDENGTVEMSSNGNEISIVTEKTLDSLQ